MLGQPIDKFLSNERGAIAIIFAFVILVLLVTVGVAVDISKAHRTKTAMASAADAAALAVARAGAHNPSLSISELRKLGDKFFRSQIQSTALLEGITKIDVDAVRNGGTVKATVTYDVNSKNSFGGFLGGWVTDVGGSAIAEIGAGALDVFLALDISDSMGLGASEDDQMQLRNEIGCVFACHTPEGGSGPTLDTAKQLSIRLRLDVLKTASQNLIDQMQTDLASSDLRVAVYSFHNNAREVQTLSSFLETAKQEIGKLELADGIQISETPGSEEQAGETLPEKLPTLLKQAIDESGPNQKKLVILITDGVKTIRPYFAGGYAGLYSYPYDPAMCDDLKAAGVEVAVVQIKYNYWQKETDPSYSSAVEYMADQIGPNLEACASPGLFFSGDQPDEIEVAMANVWNAYKTSLLRLTH